MEIITTNKGGQKLCFNGCMYTKKVARKHHIWWTCVKRTNHCKGSLTTSLTVTNPVPVLEHNHDGNVLKVEATKARSSLNDVAGQTRDKPSHLVAQTMSHLAEDARLLFGKEDSVKRMIRRARSSQHPPVPDSIEDLVIDGVWANTAGPNPEQFLIYDNGQDADARIIVFGSPCALRLLAAADTWFVDGNFSMAPMGFMQLYVIRVPLGNTGVSTVYALLQRKSQQSYAELFRAVLDYCETQELYPEPSTILCDFEQGVIKALRQVFGELNIRGCFYHLTQATWRKIQELGLDPKYHLDEDFKLFCGQLDGLAFLPLEDMEAGLDHLREIVPRDAQPLLAYFDKTYVTGSYRRAQPAHGQVGIRIKRVQPMYPPQLWNVHQATLDGEPKTNNQCEGWNNRFTHLVGYQHPSVWVLIDALQKEECCASNIRWKPVNNQNQEGNE